MAKATVGRAPKSNGRVAPRRAAVVFKSSEASKAEKIVLPRGIATVDAFRMIARSVLRHVVGNEAAVRVANPDGVHQMRIGLRRLRAAIATFGELLQDAETERLKRELKWLTGRLGPARDLHLLELRIKRQRTADRAEWLAEIAARRSRAFAGAKAAMQSARYRALLHDIRHWIEAGPWAERPTLRPAHREAVDFAADVVARRARKVMRKAERLHDLNVEQRHRLRISAKKLYYAIGFFETLFEGRKARDRLGTFQSTLKELLDRLGALNDIAVQQRLAISVAAPNGKRPHGAATQLPPPPPRDRIKIDHLLQSAVATGAELATAKRFWD
ncbi:CHAD domain-containing protein [Rhodopseudomonas palustris]|uniref:CHAD n=1 Tax=Rhodopseudomonas palustris (strain BisB18) TaxID=316056 RepID=Q20XG3_RHOPB